MIVMNVMLDLANPELSWMQVCNHGKVSRGVKPIIVDGSILEGTLVPTFGHGGVHSIEVKLG